MQQKQELRRSQVEALGLVKKPTDNLFLSQLNSFVKGEKKEKEVLKNQLLSVDPDEGKEKPLKCYVCKQNKLNHIVCDAETQVIEEDPIRAQVAKLRKREVIE